MTVAPDKFAQIDQAAHNGAFGINPLPLPTDKQIAAGTYKKGKFNLYGLTIAIEQPQNSYRTGTDKNGQRWSCLMAAHYGYILGTVGNDGDHIDCFIGSYPQSERVFVVNQYIDGVFDEHKVMLAYPVAEFARNDYNFSYARGWNGLHSIVEMSIKNFRGWLKNGDKTKPITREQLPPEDFSEMKSVFWDDASQPVGYKSVANLLYNLRMIEGDEGLLLDAVTMPDFIADADAGSVNHGVMLDSLHTPYSSLKRVCSKIGYALKMQGGKDSTGQPLVPVESTAEEPNPSGLETTFKRNGVINLAAIFQLTDGQSFTIVFHNPDSSPSKLAKTDELIAWKFLLNKRDITIAVAPEKGEDLKLPEVAKRVMLLAEKNSAAFARANKGTTERVALINSLKTEISALETEKSQAQADYEAAKAAYDEREMAKAAQSNSANKIDALAVQPIGLNEPAPVMFAGKEFTAIELPENKAQEAWNKAILESNGNEFEAAKNVYQKTLQGHYVDTKIGKVLISGMGWQEIKQGLKRESLRAKTVPYIATILKEGVAGDFEPPYKTRNDDITGFYPFTKTIKIEDKLVTVVLKVAQKTEGEFVYYLRPFEDMLDSTNENANLLRGLPDWAGVSESAKLTLDSTIEANTGGVNIVILKVTDLNGNELKELEDDAIEPDATASFDAEIENLRGLIGTDQFQASLDNLLDKLEADGVDSQYEQVVGDIMTQHAEARIAAAKGA